MGDQGEEAAPPAEEAPPPESENAPPKVEEPPKDAAEGAPSAEEKKEEAAASPAAKEKPAEAAAQVNVAPAAEGEVAEGGLQAPEDQLPEDGTELKAAERASIKAGVTDGSKMGLEGPSAIQIHERRSDTLRIDGMDLMPPQESIKSLEHEDDKEIRTASQRLGSKARAALGSIISFSKRFSTMGDQFDRSKIPRYANTYKLDSDKPFNQEQVQKILEAELEEAMEELVYEPKKCALLAKTISANIRQKVKELEFDRYKLVCVVTIGEKNSQDMLITTRFLWDPEKDRYATFVHEKTQNFGIAQCFGLYYE